LTPERWSQIEELFHRAVECAPEDRPLLLDQACGEDAELRREVESLLASEERAGDQMQAAVRGALNSVGFPLVGQTISHYVILSGLGGGGMGLVYCAEDIKLGRHVALKFLPEHSAKDSAVVERFEREARAVSALEHPNICPLYEFGEYEGQPFLAMQLLEGQTLRDLISSAPFGKPPFTLEHLLDLAIQITEGLVAAHQKGIIHRDIKPANIFVTKHAQAKILDFGLAKIAPMINVIDDLQQSDSPSDSEREQSVSDAPSRRTPDSFLSRTGVAMGTAGYMSPEQARGEKLDARSDLFSFGLVLYEMATGRRAFQGDTGPVLHRAILNQSPAPIRQVNPALPAKLEKIVGKLLEKKRDARYQSAADIRADLQKLKEEAERGPHLRRWTSVVAAVVLVIAAFWFIERRKARSLIVSEPKLTQLTVNSFENRVTGGAISPDGKYLAYADLSGLYVKLMESGETRAIPQPEEFEKQKVVWEVISTAWLPDSARFIVNAHPAAEEEGGWSSQTSSIWMVSLGGGPPTRLRDRAGACSVSPDGSLISFGSNKGKFGDREIWLMNFDGTNARKLFETDENGLIGGLMWLPGGQRISYFSADESGGTLFSRDLNGGQLVKLLSEKEDGEINDILWLPDGRLLYSLNKPEAIFNSNYWTLQFNPRTGERIGKPVQMTNFKDMVNKASVTADGKKLVFTKWTPRMTAYIGDLAEGGKRLLNLRHFPLSESSDGLRDWTQDSKALFLISNRTGQYALYKQFLDSDVPLGPLVMPPDGTDCASWTPDGKWILYFAHGSDPNKGPSMQPKPVMRAPRNGGPSQQLFIGARQSLLACSFSASRGCAIAEPTEDRKQLVMSALDPIKGRGSELARIALDPNEENWFFDLSADGSRIAVTRTPVDPIQILSVHGQPIQEVRIKGWSNIQSVTWAPDGKGLYVVAGVHAGLKVLYVDLKGNAYPLWEYKWVSGDTLASPSPDGRHLALSGWTSSSNIWMMENF
jgi:serine/threonine protein kinase/dipeptidyl aminopeptidase/acylaminoacyl peptidase